MSYNTKVRLLQGGETLEVEDGGSIEVKAGGTIQSATLKVGDTVYTLPAVDGEAGQVLSTDGAGTLSWIYSDDIAADPD